MVAGRTSSRTTEDCPATGSGELFERAVGSPEGFGSAPAFQRSWQPLWPVWRACGGTMTTGIAIDMLLARIPSFESKMLIDGQNTRTGNNRV
jgi:hypothetical protein